MAVPFLFVFLGIVGLFFGADWFVRGASELARGLRVSSAIVALTVVSLASSSPELITTLTAAVQGTADLALGNILGSNIANIGLVLGLSSLVAPLALSPATVRSGVPFSLGGAVLLYVLARDGELSRVNGVTLLIVFGVFLWIQIRDARRHREASADEPAPELRAGRDGALIAGGLAGMVVGANFLVHGARTIAQAFGLSEAFIAVSLVAVGTSLPELATSVVAARKGESDIAVGNVLGSNVLNILFVLACVIIINPLPVTNDLLRFHFPAVVGFSALLVSLLALKRLGRLPAACLVGCYVLYIALAYGRGAVVS